MISLNNSQFLSISLIYILIYIVNGLSSSADKPNCANIKSLFINEGLYTSNDRAGSNSGNSRICRKERTCCNRSIEFKLNIKSRTEFQQKFRQHINGSIEAVLIKWAEQFDNYYINAIKQGHKEFDLMFEKLYGTRYRENYELFNDLFKSIQLYHEKGDIRLEQRLNEFFGKLFALLFKMLNVRYRYNDDYGNCVAESFTLVEPFGDIPKNLLTDLKRQLGASRTFVQGLYAGAKIIRNVNQIDVSNSCGSELMQINYCSICQGYLNLKPCKANCELAYSKCVVNYQDFESEWNNYLTTILQFGRRLENTLSLENMLGSLNYKISDVIMYFQENKISISDKVLKKCEIKQLNKRSTPDESDLANGNRFKEANLKNQAITKTWKKLASEVKKKIKNLRSYWSKMPKAICKNSNQADKCWNGTHLIESSRQIKPSFIDIKMNKNTNSYRLIDSQRNALQMINKKLVSSYNGNGLENFDFDTQASNIGAISTEFIDDTNDYGPEEDDDETDYEQRKEDDNEQMPEDQLDKLTEASNNKDTNKLRSEMSQDDEFSLNESESVRKQGSNNLENDLNNVYSNLDKPRDASLNSNSYLIFISIYTLIISQFVCLLISHDLTFVHL